MSIQPAPIPTDSGVPLVDGCGRVVSHLRLSLTDHCNLSCRYCVPDRALTSPQTLDVDFAFEAVRWLSRMHGVRHVRLTGGEPLLYPHLIQLIERVVELGTVEELSLTTNGQALAQMADRLREAGLSRVNVSLDTLNPERFAELTGGGRLAHTLAGIEAAVKAGLTPVKVNAVAQRGVNDDELADLADWGLSRDCIVRFLEVMPIGPLAHVVDQHLVPASEVLDQLSRRFELRPISQTVGQPATDYAVTGDGLRGVVGVIAPTTHPFCSQCRRLRLTSQGWLVACVQDRKRFDLNPWWDGHDLNIAGAEATLHAALKAKPEIGPRDQDITMLTMGG